jgi:hypothetical protein
MKKSVLALGALLLAAVPVWAEGSINLEDVMDQLKDNEKLIGEIKSELKTQGVGAETVICVGARFGGHWAELGGARSVPYECEIGKKQLNVEGTVKLFDEQGKEIDMSDEKAPERAFSYKETDLSWKWK